MKQLAKLSGVSVRALHFYDEIGLLKPAFIAANGYRQYEEEQLLNLQQILFFRELDLSLAEVQRILSSPRIDKIALLKSHREVLEKNADRTRDLIRTIDQTIHKLKGKGTMKDKEIFRGFDPKKQAEYEMQLVERYGEGMKKHIDESKRRMKGWTEADLQKSAAEFQSIVKDLFAQFEKGARPGDEAVQAIVDRHFQWICQFWTPNGESYPGHGKMLTESADFRKIYDPYHPKLVEFFADGMAVYAKKNLAK